VKTLLTKSTALLLIKTTKKHWIRCVKSNRKTTLKITTFRLTTLRFKRQTSSSTQWLRRCKTISIIRKKTNRQNWEITDLTRGWWRQHSSTPSKMYKTPLRAKRIRTNRAVLESGWKLALISNRSLKRKNRQIKNQLIKKNHPNRNPKSR
jgi:hypothetical protein